MVELNKEGEALILKAVAGSFVLEDQNLGISSLAHARGILRQRKHRPLPGDRVRYSQSGDPDNPYVIEAVLPRKNLLIRPPVANLDYLLITISRTDPKPDFALVDKLILLAEDNQITPVLVLTKGDLDDGSGLTDILVNYWSTGIAIYLSEAGQKPDLAFFSAFEGSILAFAGQSGSGKSSFLNRQFAADLMAQGALSEKIQRGKQTTRHSELFKYDNLYLADTPGFQSLELAQLKVRAESFDLAWPEISNHQAQCKFNDCRHLGELGCAVEPFVVDFAEAGLRIRQELGEELPRQGFIREPGQGKSADWLVKQRYLRYCELRREFAELERVY